MSGPLVWLSELAAPLGATVVLRGSVIILAAALLARLLVRESAATRHAVWGLAFAALTAAPLAMHVLPRWTVVSPVPAAPAAHVAVDVSAGIPSEDVPSSGHAASAGLAASAPSHRGRSSSERDSGQPRGAPPQSAVLLLVWLVGVAAFLARLAAHAAAAGDMVRRATAVRDGRVTAVLREIASRDVRVVSSGETQVPMVCGLRRPVLVLPAGSEDWSSGLLRAVLLHELAHVARRDLAMHLLTRVAVAFYWPNPLVWLAARRIAFEQERACDDCAMRGGPPQAYATHLLEVARLPRPRNSLAGALAMSGKLGLLERIRSVLDTTADRRAVSRGRLTILAGLLALVAVPVIALRIRQAPAPDPHLFTALSGADVSVQQRAAWGLGEFESRSGVPALLERLDDPHPAVRGAVIWALGEIKDARAVVPIIERLRQDADPLVREMAVLALGEIGARRAVPPLIEAARREPALVPAALWALGEISHGTAATARRELRFAVPDAVRWADGSDHSERVHWDRRRDLAAVDSAVTALSAGERLVRTHAAWSLGRIGDPRGVGALLGALRDPEPNVRAMAVWALDEINPSRDVR